MFNLGLCASICDWDIDDHKQYVNIHGNVLGNLNAIYHLD